MKKYYVDIAKVDKSTREHPRFHTCRLRTWPYDECNLTMFTCTSTDIPPGCPLRSGEPIMIVMGVDPDLNKAPEGRNDGVSGAAGKGDTDTGISEG